MAKLKYLRRILEVDAPECILFIVGGVNSCSIIQLMQPNKTPVLKVLTNTKPDLIRKLRDNALEQANKTKTKVLLEDVDDNDSYLIEPHTWFIIDPADIEQWRKWRDEQKVPRSSMLSSYYGEGYALFSQEIRSLFGQKGKPTTRFAKNLMDHGVRYEPEARKIFMMQNHIEDGDVILSGDQSIIYSVGRTSDEKFDILATPDLFFRDGPDHCVAEFKCPAYGIANTKLDKICVSDSCSSFYTKYPHGKTPHFIQVSTYAFLTRSPTFFLFYLFTDGITQYSISLKFKMTDSLQSLIFDSIRGCWKFIKEYTPKTTDKQLKRPKKNYTETIDGIRTTCFINGHVTGHQVRDLEKQSPDQCQ